MTRIRTERILPHSTEMLDLVCHAKAGSRPAFEALARHWHKRLVAHALRLTKEREIAEEAAQGAWIDIARGLRGLRDAKAFPAWAYRIVTRRCATLIGKKQGNRDLLEELRNEPLEHSVVDEYICPKVVHDLQSAISGLPPGQRAALALHYFDYLSIAEVAVALAIPAGTVKTRLMHARNSLKAFLQEQNDEK